MTNKMTQKNAITYVLTNCDMPTDVRNKLSDILASLERKSSGSVNRKPTATQIANEGHKQTILNSMKRDTLYTITEMTKEFDFGVDMSVNKCSAIVKQMVQSNLIERVEDKRKAYFRLINQ